MKIRIGLILAALAVAGGILYSSYQVSVRQAYLAEYHAVVEELDVERGLVEDAYNRLREDRIQLRSCGKAALLFEDPKTALYTEVFPLVRSYGFTGIVAISPTQYPGAEGCITPSEFQALSDAGWETCAWWDGNDPQTSFDALQAIFRRLGMTMPSVICVEEYAYTPNLDAVLADAGFTAVIHHGETLDLFDSLEDPLLAHLGAACWNNPLALNLLEDVMSKRETLAISADFSTDFGWFDGELYPNMCSFLQQNEDNLQVTDLADVLVTVAETEAYFQAREEYLLSELARYDQEIAAVYELYRQYGAELEIPSHEGETNHQ